MALRYYEIDVDGYERVVEAVDGEGFQAFIAIHNTSRGVALGGCRVTEYTDRNAQLTDALNLAKGMTYKSALAGLDLGGGKATINAPVATKEVLNLFGEFMEYINKDKMVYITAGDVGTGPGEVAYLSSRTGYVNGQNLGEDSGYATAFGVYQSLLGAVRFKGYEMSKQLVTVEGLGKVGMRLVDFMHKDVKRVYTTDLHHSSVADAFEKYQAIPLPDTAWTTQLTNVYAPCALGGTLTEDRLDRMTAGDIVCGGANNQFYAPGLARLYHNKGIAVVPDYLANAGGVIIVNGSYKDGSWKDKEIHEKLVNLGDITFDVLTRAEEENVPPMFIANTMAEEAFNV